MAKPLPIETNWRATTAVRVSNWLLNRFAPNFANALQELVEYGMRSRAWDLRHHVPRPPDWHPDHQCQFHLPGSGQRTCLICGGGREES